MASSAPTPLVYTQDERFVAAVGEPLPIESITRVVIGKWDALYADGLRSACERTFPGGRVEICRRGSDLIETLRAAPADFALMGLTFIDLDGVDVLHAISRGHLARRVMVVSGRKDEHSLNALRAAPFDGLFDPFVETVAGLEAALRRVADGRGYLSPSLLREFGSQRTVGVVASYLTLTELQVFCVIGDGSDDTEAAERLGMRRATVCTHRRNIMRKLHVSTSAKLVREAVRLGVVQIKSDGAIVRPAFNEVMASREARKSARN